MALSMQLGLAGMVPENIASKSAVTLDKDDSGFTITAVHLDIVARIPGADQQAFEQAAKAAKEGCPVSKLLNAKITMDARLDA
jgi:osmotically inducible protein OsmC